LPFEEQEQWVRACFAADLHIGIIIIFLMFKLDWADWMDGWTHLLNYTIMTKRGMRSCCYFFKCGASGILFSDDLV